MFSQAMERGEAPASPKPLALTSKDSREEFAVMALERKKHAKFINFIKSKFKGVRDEGLGKNLSSIGVDLVKTQI